MARGVYEGSYFASVARQVVESFVVAAKSRALVSHRMDYLLPELGINPDSAHVVMATHGGPTLHVQHAFDDSASSRDLT